MSLPADQIAHFPTAVINDAFAVLGLHEFQGTWWVRVYRPGAVAVTVHPEGGEPFALAARGGVDGYFEGAAPRALGPFRYELAIDYPAIHVRTRDSYSFWPLIDEWDLARFAEGRHHHIEQVLGAQACTIDGCDGVRFSVWAPNAQRVAVVGDFNLWNGAVHGMRPRVPYGVWEIFIPEVPVGALYQFEIRGADGSVRCKADPCAVQAQRPSETASVVCQADDFIWSDDAWMEERIKYAGSWHKRPMAIYEVHLYSWMQQGFEQPLDYEDLAERLVTHCRELNYTHIELLPIASHPYPGSWGYQVLGHYAPSAFHGSPEQLRQFVDRLHRHGIGVIIDYVPAHFPKDDWGLARYDGSACFEYDDPREGEHKDWDTLIFNYRRPEVRNFLLGAALYWMRSYHIDGIRVDAVSSMLYRNYSRQEGEWIPNEHGGNANTEAVSFLQELNALTHMLFPGVLTIAEESTAWQGVTAPTDWDGLGFDLKWNMGWMHDTLRYLAQDPVMRPGCHDWITFHQWYAYDERWILPLSHDEVVHGKGSLLDKMHGDWWQRLAQLRLLYGYQVAIPGRPLQFMGGEFAQGREWAWHEGLQWGEAEQDERKRLMHFLRDVLALYRREPALHELDDQRQGFRWVDVENRAESIVAFMRTAYEQPDVLIGINFTPVPRYDYGLHVPTEGVWTQLINSDDQAYGGGGTGVEGDQHALRQADGRIILRVCLPPLGIVFWRGPGC